MPVIAYVARLFVLGHGAGSILHCHGHVQVLMSAALLPVCIVSMSLLMHAH